MARTGRPRIEIDKTQFKKLCAMQCTLEEIAGFFNCTDDTINNWCKREYKQTFSAIYKTLSAGGKISLRRNAFRIAETNPGMCIFLLKNYCGLTDQPADTSGQNNELLQSLLDLEKKAADNK
jgi:hypothetical protein